MESTAIIQMPPRPTYGAVELKAFINKYTIRGFIITLALIILFFIVYTVQQIIAHSASNTLTRPPIVTSIDLTAPPPSEDVDNTPPPPQAPQVINYGMEARAGTPVPIPDAQVKADLDNFADMKDLDRALSKTGTQDIADIPDFKVEDLNKNQSFAKEEIPPEDAFIPVEKDPYIDLAELQKKVVYPEMARNAGIEGKVLIRIYVDKNGKPKKTIIQQSDSKMLEQAAIDAVMKSVFTPAIQNKQPIGCWVTIPIHFKLR